MNGLHDMGGMQCFGTVAEVPDDPMFHHEWERRVFALTVALGTGGAWNIDASRFVRESLPPSIYLDGGYYRIWLEALQVLMVRAGLVSEEELARLPGVWGTVAPSQVTALPMLPAAKPFRRLAAEEVEAQFAKGWSAARSVSVPARFAVGDRILTINDNPSGHTRLPRYARGRRGVIHAVHGVHVFPDSHALFGGERPQWLYSVRFEGTELWGQQSSASCVFLDCWEPYLRPVPDR